MPMNTPPRDSWGPNTDHTAPLRGIPVRGQDEIRVVRLIFAIERMREPFRITREMRAILPEKCHFEKSWNCEASHLQRPRHVVRVAVNHIKLT
jgi:hypothetical protein